MTDQTLSNGTSPAGVASDPVTVTYTRSTRLTRHPFVLVQSSSAIQTPIAEGGEVYRNVESLWIGTGKGSARAEKDVEAATVHDGTTSLSSHHHAKHRPDLKQTQPHKGAEDH